MEVPLLTDWITPARRRRVEAPVTLVGRRTGRQFPQEEEPDDPAADERQRAVAARAVLDGRGCPASLAARAALASWAHRRTAGAVAAAPVPARPGPPARGVGRWWRRRRPACRPRSGWRRQGRWAGRGRAATWAAHSCRWRPRRRCRWCGAGGRGAGQGGAGQGYPAITPPLYDQGGEGDPPSSAGPCGGRGLMGLRPRPLPVVFVAGVLAARRHAGRARTARWDAGRGIATSGPVKLSMPAMQAPALLRHRPAEAGISLGARCVFPGPGRPHVPKAWPLPVSGRARPGYIRSGTGIPSMPSPAVRIRSARAQSASLLSRSSGSGAPSTGHSS